MVPAPDRRASVRRTGLGQVLGACALLVLAHVALHLWYPGRHAVPPAVRMLFDLSGEESLGTWVSVGAQLVLGLGCLAVGRREGSRAWLATGALFLFLSADDEAQIHERLGWLLPDPDGKAGVYAWVIGFAPLYALAGGLAFLHLWRATSERAERRLVVAAAGCLALALALEACEGPLAASGRTWRGVALHSYTVPFEEGLELLAPGLLLLVVGARLRRSAEASEIAGARVARRRGPAPNADARRSDAA